jgi:eukaryotic-like serine/threonine-protein kinase
MKYIEGEPAVSDTVPGPLPLEDSLRIATQIAGALEAAHKHGILHRDLKPANILVTPRGAKLLDFGLAKITSGTAGEVTQTREDTVVGTAAYMSPEQAQGKHLDERSDIFSFGCVLYEMLSGRRAFDGSSIAEVLSAVIRDEPAKLTTPLAPVVAKCLAKAPEQRFQTMAEVRVALEEIRAKPADARPSVAVLPFANMSSDSEQEYFSDGLAEEIINLLAQTPGLKVIARTSAFAFRGKELDIRTIAAALGVTTVLEGSVRRSGKRLRVIAQLISAEDGTHLFSDRYDREMSDVFTMQDEIAAAIASTLLTKLSLVSPNRRQYTPRLPAYEALLKARHSSSLATPASLAKAREYLEQAIVLDPDYALPHAELGFLFNVFAVMGVMPAREAVPLGRASARKALEVDPSLPDALSMLGYHAAFFDYDWKEAGRLFAVAMAHGRFSPMASNRYARYLAAIGRVPEGLEVHRRALSEDPLNPYLRMNLVVGLRGAGRAGEAVDEIHLILERHENFGLAWHLLALSLLHFGKHAEALSAAERGLALMPWHAPSRGLLAGLLALAGDHDGAAKTLERLGHGEAYTDPAGFMFYFLILGKLDEAVDWAARAIDQRFPVIVDFLCLDLAAAELRRSPRWPELATMMNLPSTDGGRASTAGLAGQIGAQ